jgi:GTP cyclohydrolase FolE2
VDQALKTVSDVTTVLSSDVVTITSGARVSSNLRVRALCASVCPCSRSCSSADVACVHIHQEFLEPLINQCLHELRSPDSKIAISCGKILEAAASASGTNNTSH